ncbi:MAG: FAD-dependent oxidoreductase, partial [Patescibacteria group bacterium]
MKQIKYLIIGGGVTGTTAAETIRQNDKENGIMIISDEPYRFYSRIMLSKPAFFLGKIPFDKIWLKTEEWYQKNNIELLAGRKAVKLDSRNKTVALDNGDKINYEKLLLAIGGHSRELQIPGSDKNGVLYLRNLSDAKAIAELVKTAKKSV